MTHLPTPGASRHRLIAQMRARLGYPRMVVMLMLAVAGLAAFGVSTWLLGAGVRMASRYFLATLAGYAVFLLMIRVWIAIRRRDVDARDAGDVLDAVDIAGDVHDLVAGGGKSGGAGAGSSWGDSADGIVGIDVVPDADDAWPVVIAVVVLCGGVLALFYVVYAAPILLAEVALDAALVASVYRRLRKKDIGHWLSSALRLTWLPALVVAVCVGAGGLALELAMPEARSLGDVFRALGN